MRITRSTALGAALVLALAGCQDARPDPGGPPPDGQPSTPDGDARGSTHDVRIRNVAFSPTRVEVAVGDTVRWQNADVVRHTVTSGPPGSPDGRFDEPLGPDGAQATITFDEPGTYAYHCDLHRTMTAEVVVAG